MPHRRFTIVSILLLPLSGIYLLIVSLRNLLFDWGILQSTDHNIPIISVGNISVGGTGKTPHVEYLIDLLKPEFKLATLSRGYKRKTRHFIVADENSGVSLIGDEARQLKQKYPELTVSVDRRRVNGIKQLMKLANSPDVILLDDAYQHRYVNPGKSILLIDYMRPVFNDLVLPSGRLREPAAGKKRADIILFTKSPERIKPIEMRNIAKKMNLALHQHLFFTTIEYDSFIPVFDAAPGKDFEYFSKQKSPVLMITGIADPRPLRRYARSISTKLHEIHFPDHHNFSKKELDRIYRTFKELNDPDAIILTTEKDAMRFHEADLNEKLKTVMYYVSIRIKFLNKEQETEFNNLILSYVRSNKRNNILHKGADRT